MKFKKMLPVLLLSTCLCTSIHPFAMEKPIDNITEKTINEVNDDKNIIIKETTKNELIKLGINNDIKSITNRFEKIVDKKQSPKKSKNLFKKMKGYIEKKKTANKKKKKSLKSKKVGVFKLTAYCPCKKCSGKWGGGTATGAKAKEGKTIAVDPKEIPLGSKVKIGKHTYVAQDVGGAIKGKRIDIFFRTHQRALNFGVKKAKISVEK